MDTLLIMTTLGIIVVPPLGWILTVLVGLAMFDRRARLDNSALMLAIFGLILNLATAIVLWSGSGLFGLNGPMWFTNPWRIVSLAALSLSAFVMVVCCRSRYAR
jgi:hypothetical protein